jgi:malate synthase
MAVIPQNIAVIGGDTPNRERVLSAGAVEFIARLHREFNSRRLELLEARRTRRERMLAGERPGFPAETASIRQGDWRVASTPPALLDRRVEITGPVDRKMMINALNSGASAFMADFEDSLSPTWENVVEGQANVMEAVRGTLTFSSPDGREYRLAEKTATLLVRPRGWHLDERHLLVDGEPASASLVDFGLCFFHNAREQLSRGAGPYFYLPKLENRHEARLWNEVFVFAQENLGIPVGSIRATVLIETILAAFEMDEILHELREHVSGLNAGRWDYIFSVIKQFRHDEGAVLPDRAQVTMTVPFMRAYTELLVRTCHRRGAHAMGGMAAYIPSRRDAEVNDRALAKVREDKERESRDGFDGTWVAHPDLVPVAREAFDQVLGDRPHQRERMRDDVTPDDAALLEFTVPGGAITREGVRTNVSVALQYIESWLRGSGAVAINNLMEDAATAEISRAQLWQWRRLRVLLADGTEMSAELYEELREVELAGLQAAAASDNRFADAAELLDRLVLDDDFEDFLTIPGYQQLGEGHATQKGGR